MIIRISQQDVREFARWSADINPVHVNPEAAKNSAFGGTIVHGALSTIECLKHGRSDLSQVRPITSLNIEFRVEVRPEHDYLVEWDWSSPSSPASDSEENTVRDLDAKNVDQRLTIVVKDRKESPELMSVRAGFEPVSDELGSAGWVAAACSDGIRSSSQDQPIDWKPADFRRGQQIVGVHQFGKHGTHEDSLLTNTQEKVLGLCSFIVGMKAPGLSSLFTQLKLRFGNTDFSEGQLAYRLTFKNYDPHFRLLETDLEVATVDGQAVAHAEIQSYVRFPQIPPSPAAYVGQLSPQTTVLEGSVALVCGASRGLGAELACALGAAKSRVYLSCRKRNNSVESIAQQIRDCGGAAEIVVGDAGDPQWCESTRDQIHQREGRLDLLILNACAPPVYNLLADADPVQSMSYVSANMGLAQTPLVFFLPLVSQAKGSIVGISSSFVDESPAGFADYLAVKKGMEGVLETAAREQEQVQFLVARPPKLRTSWNDTPTGAMGAIPASVAATQIVNAVANMDDASNFSTLTSFPFEEQIDTPLGEPDWNLVVVASFTLDPVVEGFQCWSQELGLNIAVELAPYAQILQQLLDPLSVMSKSQNGSVVMLRVSDWLRERVSDKVFEQDRENWLQEVAAEHVDAFRTHRSHAAGRTLLLVCSSSPISGLSDSVVASVETTIKNQLQSLPGLTVMDARDYHGVYEVPENLIADPLREEIAHIPFTQEYFLFLATLVVRFFHQRMSPPKKVVVLDCDNTLWRGVVGEAGPAGIEFDDIHRRFHRRLVELSEAGVLICLCSKNEEHDVWAVFDQRDDFGLKKEHIVAAAVNWLPKSHNIRELADNLNLGLDSFVFLDDNPVECAEVRDGCAGVLTLQWPQDTAEASRLLNHLWELDVFQVTEEDKQRTQRYREEFHRQESRQSAGSFQDFIDSLELNIDIRALDEGDLPRASQLTMRTNQFNFTTIRRTESELVELMHDDAYVCRTVRVSDRFGDYGLVGFLIGKALGETFHVDTFLLSCRVLGRGVEHKMAAELGRLAIDGQLASVCWKHVPTERNTPARMFLEKISPDRQHESSSSTMEVVIDAELLSQFQLEAVDVPADVTAPVKVTPAAKKQDLSTAPREREQQIMRTANALGTFAQFVSFSGSDGLEGEYSSVDLVGDIDELAYAIRATFAKSLRTTVDEIVRIDRLDALGCDSLRIVEITILLTRQFPWLPKTLLFEHRSVTDIVDQVVHLASGAVEQDSSEGGGFSSARSATVATDDVAIVGIGVHCAAGHSVDELWQLLVGGFSAIKEVPVSRSSFVGKLRDERKHFVGLIDDAADFDPEFFGISPREAEYMDPQLRLLLQTSWHALEDAGAAGDRFEVDTGVFVGAMYAGYLRFANAVASQTSGVYRCWEGFSLANRLSQVLGASGPSLSIDTACSSSATALHYACRSIQQGDCKSAVVSGVNLIIDPDRLGQLGRLGILSPTGKCVPFGSEADGTVMGEGVVSVVLRPLSEAKTRGDRIYAIVKGTGISSGAGSVGFTAPNPTAQAVATRAAIAAAGIDARTVTYIETHGTGTELGDPIEVRGLELAYCDRACWDPEVQIEHRCTLGSIKPNVGHLEAGAGLMGVVKSALQIYHRTLAPSLTSESPNEQIPFQELPFDVQVSRTVWNRHSATQNGEVIEVPLRSGVNSFGVGGSNVHIILEESPLALVDPTPPSDRSGHLLAVSASSQVVMDQQVEVLSRHLNSVAASSIADCCFSANVGRKHDGIRTALLLRPDGDSDRIVSQMTPSAEQNTDRSKPGRTAFLFSGQGAQYPTMLQGLHRSSTVFREAFNRCARILAPLLPKPIDEIIFSGQVNDRNHVVHQTGFTQPALFSVQYALYQLWTSWGVAGDVLMGHSVGEIAAFCVSGGCSLEDGLQLVAARGQLMQALPPGGGMCSVPLGRDKVLAILAEQNSGLVIAAMNAPAQTVVSGRLDAIDELVTRLDGRGIKATALSVSHAFHSELMDPMLGDFEKVLRQLDLKKPASPIISTATGKFVSGEMATPEYWLDQARNSVKFVDAMASVGDHDISHFIEIGPHPVMLGMGRHCLPTSDAAWLPSVRRGHDDWLSMLGSLGQLYADGFEVDWLAFDSPYNRKRVSCPGYQFDRRRIWIDELDSGMPELSCASTKHTSFDSDGEASSLVYRLDWQVAGRKDAVATAVGAWLLVANQSSDAESLAQTLTTQQIPHEVLELANTSDSQIDHFLQLHKTCGRIVFVDRAIKPPEPVEVILSGSIDRVDQFTRLVASIDRMSLASSRLLWVVTCRAMVGAKNQAIGSLAASPLWGIARVAALECDAFWGGIIDLEDLQNDGCAAIDEISVPNNDDQVVFRGSDRMVPRLLPVASDLAGSFDSTNLDLSDGAVLITGGLGGVGIRVACWLAEQGAQHLVLSSRSGTPTDSVAELIQRMRSRGTQVDVIAADASTPDGVKCCLEATGGAPLIGVFHAAGIDLVLSIEETSRNDIEKLWAAKVRGAWLLHEACQGMDLRWFVCFSSIASIWGSSGRSLYAAANSFLDGLTHYRRQQGLHALTVNFGPWTGGGMASDEDLAALEQIGNFGLPPCKALSALGGLLKQDAVQAVVANVDWQRFRSIFEARRPRPLLSELGLSRSPVGARNNQVAPWIETLSDTAVESRADKLQGLLGGEISQLLRLSSEHPIPLDRNFFELGMDSLLSVELVNLLTNKIGLKSKISLAASPTVRLLSQDLLPKLEQAISSSSVQISDDSTSASEWHNELSQLNESDRTEHLLGLIRKEVSGLVGTPVAEISIDTELSEIGLDSLGAVEFANRIRRRMNLPQSPRVLEYGSLKLLAAHLGTGLPEPETSSGGIMYRPDLGHKVFQFCKVAWPNRQTDLIEPRWRWMFVDSARLVGVEPQVWLYATDQKIVGHHGAQFVRLKIGDEVRTTAWFVDTMVVEEYRDRGIGAQLVMQSYQDMPFSLSLGQTEQMRTILKRIGWKEVTPLQTYMLLLNPGKVLKQKLPGYVTPFASAWFNLRSGTRRLVSVPSSPVVEVNDIEKFGGQYDELWGDISPCYDCAVVRDASYLNWKYVDQPGQSFVRLEVTRDGQLIGCVILSVSDPDHVYQYRRTHVIDIVTSTEPEYLYPLISAAVNRSRELSADAVFMHLINSEIQQALENVGFLKRSPTRYLMVSTQTRADHERLLNPAQWLITHGDSDIDRPW